MYAKPPIVPPQVHPRLFLREVDIPLLRERRRHPKLVELWKKLESMAAYNSSEVELVDFMDTVYMIEANSLIYLLDGNQEAGHKAKAEALQAIRRQFKSTYLDISREIGRLMLGTAMFYDWCHELLTEAEKLEFIRHYKRLSKLMECGYPPVKESSVTGHISEWMVMRDMLGAGIAVYNEDSEMYDLAAGRFFQEIVPVRNFFYRSGWHNQGDNYGNVRFECELYPTMMFAAMGCGDVYDQSQGEMAYRWIYMRRPDGKFLRDGDGEDSARPLGIYAGYRTLTELMSAYHFKNPYFQEEFDRRFPEGIEDPKHVIFAFLFTDPKLIGKSKCELPLTRYFPGPVGGMIARTGWDEAVNMESSVVVAEMKIGEYQFNNHQHLDAGAFQIYYKGYLAIDSGMYYGSSGKYNSPHNKYYYKRTIAHNCMLVYDPNEIQRNPYILGDGHQDWPNHDDGGQRWPNHGKNPLNLDELLNGDFERAKVLSHEFGVDPHEPDYSHLKGDLTRAYDRKVSKHIRSFVFLNFKDDKYPAALIVFDRVVSTDASFQKTWLLHSIDEPSVYAPVTVFTQKDKGYNGKLIHTAILPEIDNVNLCKVGGPGKEFWVRDTNYITVPDVNHDYKEQGAWRIEVSPVQSAKEDLFLNVLQVQDANRDESPYPRKLESEQFVGVQLSGKAVFFNKRSERYDQSFKFYIEDSHGAEGTSDKMIQCIVTDVAEGQWEITHLDSGKKVTAASSREGGVLQFQMLAGKVLLQRVN